MWAFDGSGRGSINVFGLCSVLDLGNSLVL